MSSSLGVQVQVQVQVHVQVHVQVQVQGLQVLQVLKGLKGLMTVGIERAQRPLRGSQKSRPTTRQPRDIAQRVPDRLPGTPRQRPTPRGRRA